MKTVGAVSVQNYIDNFNQMKEYDNFASYWASWNAQQMLARLREVHPDPDIGFLEDEFDKPTGVCPDTAAEEEEVS